MATTNPSLHSSTRRWVVLLAYTAVAGVSQMLWLNFAPLISMLQDRYEVSEFMAVSLTLVFPLLYVILSLHAGAQVDRRGYRVTVGAGAVIMAIFACVRIYDSNFYALLIGQTGIAVAQPYIVNGISKLVADWFEEEKHGLTTGIGTIGMFLGMALALAITPALVDTYNLQFAMIVFAVVALLAALFFLLTVKENETNLESHAGENEPVSFKTLIQNSNLAALFVISFLELGFFNGLTTFLEPMLAERSIDAETAGLAGGMLIVGGIVGSAIVPALSDFVRRRKPFLILCAVASLFFVYPLCTAERFSMLLVLGGITGFCFLPGYALLFAMTEEHAGAAHAGAATGILMLTGNAGGVAVVLAMEAIKGMVGNWLTSIYLMIALLVFATLIAFRVRESIHAQ
ncbi:MAG: MFS transporter [Leptospiraceae bacterium]|nr:MFS transporter [Leptospiraceae bacterium]